MPQLRQFRTLLKNVPTITQVRRPILTPDLNTPLGYRDRTMIMVTYAGALRRKEQEVPVGALAMEYLSSFISHYRPMLRPKGQWVFPTQTGERVSGKYFREILAGQNAGLGIHPHALRHGAATHMMRNGGGCPGDSDFSGA